MTVESLVRTVERLFDENDYDRAHKGTATGGQFVAKGDSGQPAKKKATTPRKAVPKKAAAKKAPTSLDEAARRSWASFGTVSEKTPAGDQRIHDLQTLLRGLGYDVTPDGRYGEQTAAAVRQLQAKLGVHQTGHMTSGLMRKLQAAAILSPCARESVEVGGGVMDSVRTERGTVVSAADLIRVAENFDPRQMRAPKGTAIGGRWVSMHAVARLLGHEPDKAPHPLSTGRFKTAGGSVISVSLPHRRPRIDDRIRDPHTGALGTVQTTHPDGTGRIGWDDGRVESRRLDELRVPGERDLPDPNRTFDLPAGPPPSKAERTEPGPPRTSAEKLADLVASGNVPTDTRREVLGRLALQAAPALGGGGVDTPSAPRPTGRVTAAQRTGLLRELDGLLAAGTTVDGFDREGHGLAGVASPRAVIQGLRDRVASGETNRWDRVHGLVDGLTLSYGTGRGNPVGDLIEHWSDRITAPSGSPAVVKMAKAKAPTSSIAPGDHVAALSAMNSREEATAYVAKLRGKELDEVIRASGGNVAGTVAQKRTQLVEHTVGYRLNSAAIRHGSWDSSGRGPVPPPPIESPAAAKMAKAAASRLTKRELIGMTGPEMEQAVGDGRLSRAQAIKGLEENTNLVGNSLAIRLGNNSPDSLYGPDTGLTHDAVRQSMRAQHEALQRDRAALDRLRAAVPSKVAQKKVPLTPAGAEDLAEEITRARPSESQIIDRLSGLNIAELKRFARAMNVQTPHTFTRTTVGPVIAVPQKLTAGELSRHIAATIIGDRSRFDWR